MVIGGRVVSVKLGDEMSSLMLYIFLKLIFFKYNYEYNHEPNAFQIDTIKIYPIILFVFSWL